MPRRPSTALIPPLLAAAGLALAACASRPSASGTAAGEAAGGPDPVLPVDPKVTRGTLDNGLRYVIRANSKPENRAELRLALDVGSILETDEEQGLAHFAEHMAFNGTTHFEKQELWSYLESVGLRTGADLNAHTSFDETVYKLTVPLDSVQVVEQAFQIFEDWAHGISFDGEEIDKERGVVIEEWRRGQGAGLRMLYKQLPVLFADSKYAERIPIGQKAVLDTFHHDTLRGFYRRWYRPDLMGFVAVGDFEPAWMESLITEYMGRVPAVPEETVRPEAPVPDHEETLFSIVTDPEATSNVVRVMHKQDRSDESTKGAYREGLMESLYHGMLNRRLYELTTRADPPFLGAFSGGYYSVRTKEMIQLAAGVENNGFDRGLEALLTEAERVRQHGFTATELARQKKEQLRGMEQAWRERDKLQSRGFAAEYVRHLLDDEPIPGIEGEYELHQELLPTITLEEVNELAGEWTGGRNRVITVTAPDREGVGVPTRDQLLAILEMVAARPVEAYVDQGADLPLLPDEPQPGSVASRGEIPELGVTRWELSNGVRVFLKPTDFKNDQILFRAYSPGGHSLVEDGEFVAASTAATVVTEGGLGNFDKVGLIKWLSGKVVSVSPYVSELEEGLSGSASPQDAGAMFQMIHAYFTATRSDSAAFASLRTRLRAWLENRSADPETAFADTVSVTMSRYHHRARPWSLAMLDELDLDASVRIFRDPLRRRLGLHLLLRRQLHRRGDGTPGQPLPGQPAGAGPRRELAGRGHGPAHGGGEEGRPRRHGAEEPDPHFLHRPLRLRRARRPGPAGPDGPGLPDQAPRGPARGPWRHLQRRRARLPLPLAGGALPAPGELRLRPGAGRGADHRGLRSDRQPALGRPRLDLRGEGQGDPPARARGRPQGERLVAREPPLRRHPRHRPAADPRPLPGGGADAGGREAHGPALRHRQLRPVRHAAGGGRQHRGRDGAGSVKARSSASASAAPTTRTKA